MLLDHMYIAALVTRIQNNDSNAFAELYALTYQKEYHFACNYLKDPVLAQDALQETYIRAYRNIARLQRGQTFRFMAPFDQFPGLLHDARKTKAVHGGFGRRILPRPCRFKSVQRSRIPDDSAERGL